LFLNTSSDASLLPVALAAAEEVAAVPRAADMQLDVEQYAMEPLFVRGVSDRI
jgi:hypothetical protein